MKKTQSVIAQSRHLQALGRPSPTNCVTLEQSPSLSEPCFSLSKAERQSYPHKRRRVGSPQREGCHSGLSAPDYPQEATHGLVSTMWVQKPQKAGSVPRLEPQEPYRNHIRATTAPPAHRDFRCCLSQAKRFTDCLAGVLGLQWINNCTYGSPPPTSSPGTCCSTTSFLSSLCLSNTSAIVLVALREGKPGLTWTTRPFPHAWPSFLVT